MGDVGGEGSVMGERIQRKGYKGIREVRRIMVRRKEKGREESRNVKDTEDNGKEKGEGRGRRVGM